MWLETPKDITEDLHIKSGASEWAMEKTVILPVLLFLLVPTIYCVNVSATSQQNNFTDQKNQRDNGSENIINTTVIAAIIAAAASIIASILTGIFGSLNQRRLTSLQGESQRRLALLQEQIESRKKKADARTTYEYDARKRLYEQCEPILFQIYELSESANHRLADIPQQVKEGKFQVADGSTADDPYALQSTIFRLLLPLSAFKLLQRKLTYVDLKVDKRVSLQYKLLRRLYLSFSSDFNLSSREPRLTYDPYKPVLDDERKNSPQIYDHQGIKMGKIDILVKALIIDRNGQIPGLMDFGEFQDAYRQNKDGVFSDIRSLFMNFHPRTRPVLWRILIAQTHIYQALLRTYTTKDRDDESLRVLRLMSDEEKKKFDWRQEKEKITISPNKVFDEPFNAVEAYLQEYLSTFFK